MTAPSTATMERTLQEVLDEANPDEVYDALQLARMGTTFAPLKRTFAGLTPATSFDLTAIDGTGETVGPSNLLRLAALLFRSLRVGASAASGNLSGGSDAVKASLDLSTKTVRVNTVIQAKVAGAAGDAFTIAFVNDGAGVGSLTLSGSDYTFHYATGVTTVTNFETLITASVNLAVKTPGTGANLVTATGDTFALTHLAAGADAVKASLNMATVGSGEINAVLEAKTAGAAGNGQSIVVIGDSPAAGGVTLTETSTVTTIHYESGVSTDGNVETKITASSALLDVKTPGTGSTVINDQESTGGGVYAVTDVGGTPLVAGTKIGLATISDDGKTLTFADTVDGFTVEYLPRTQQLSSWQKAFASSPSPGLLRLDQLAPQFRPALDLSTKTTHCNAVIEVLTPNVAYTIAFAADGAGTGTLVLTGTAYVFHYATGVTTDANFEALIAASGNLRVRKAGTGANVLSDPGDTFAAILFPGLDPDIGFL